MNGAFHAPPLTVPPVFAKGQSRRESPKMASRPFQFWEKNPSVFSWVCPQVRDILSRSPAWDEGRGHSYTPCLLMKPVLRLRLHAAQSQSCFPAASNALALPVGNLIFAATPTERITHYTLRAKSCAKGQAPLETPDNKTGWISRTSPVLDIQPLFVVSSPRFVVCV